MNSEILQNDSSRELSLFAVNDYATYNNAIVPTIRCLAKKLKAGTFDAPKARKAFYNVATYAAKAYARAYCDNATPYYKVFSIADRRLVAAGFLAYFMEDIIEASEE